MGDAIAKFAAAARGGLWMGILRKQRLPPLRLLAKAGIPG